MYDLKQWQNKKRKENSKTKKKPEKYMILNSFIFGKHTTHGVIKSKKKDVEYVNSILSNTPKQHS